MNPFNTLKIGLLSFLILLSPLVTQAQIGDDDATIMFVDCIFPIPAGEIEGETMECGLLIVPEDRTNPNSPEIEIEFAILYTPNPNPRPDPVIYLMGGPGGSSLYEISGWTRSAFRAERDLILVDQRGTGYSYPRLWCPEVEDLDAAEDGILDFDAAYEQALIDCMSFYQDDGFDLSQYNTINNAHDFADLMALLADEFIEYDAGFNLFGVSYGTRLALEIVRSHPENVRSIIIDAVYPTNVNAYDEMAVNTYRLFNQIFGDCAADSVCDAAFPNLGVRFYQLLDQLNAEPADLDEFGELLGDELIEEIFGLAYDSFVLPYLPLMIDGVARGDYEVLFAIWEGLIYPDMDEPFTIVDEFIDAFFAVSDDLDDDDYFDMFDELDEVYFDFADDPDIIREIIEDYMGFDEILMALMDALTDDELLTAFYFIIDGDLSDSDGMFNSVECYEEVPFNSLEGAEALALQAGVPEAILAYELFGLGVTFEVCRVWNVGQAPASFKAPVVSDIPALVISGMYDPITPPAWGAVAAQTLSNSFVYDLPNIGHGGVDLPDFPCGTTLALSFLNDPFSQPDDSCVADLRIEFITSLD